MADRSLDPQGPRAIALIVCTRDVLLVACREQGSDIGGVAGVLHDHVAVREEDGVEWEPLEASAVHLGDGQSVAGDADEPCEAFLSSLTRSSKGTVLAERQLPFGGVDEAVKLNEIDMIDGHPVERAADLLTCRCIRPLACLGRQEEVVTVVTEPGSKPELGLAVARCGVDVIDPTFQEERESAVRFGLRDVCRALPPQR